MGGGPGDPSMLCYRGSTVATESHVLASSDGVACEGFIRTISEFSRVHAIKLYRLSVTLPEPVPRLPCLDHEAMLHEDISPHAAMYIEDLDSGGLHEIVCVPARRRIEIDIVSTAEEHSVVAHDRLVQRLTERFPGYDIRISGPSWLRGDRRVARACRAQIPLRDVLMETDFEHLTAAMNRLRVIGQLMEKQSRVASWSVRTLTGPLLAFAGFASYGVLGLLTAQIGVVSVQGLRYAVVGVLGAVFLYFGLKAVHLTEMANRVWKRSSEYGLILAERRRLAATTTPAGVAAQR